MKQTTKKIYDCMARNPLRYHEVREFGIQLQLEPEVILAALAELLGQGLIEQGQWEMADGGYQTVYGVVVNKD